MKSILSVLALAVALVAAVPAKDTADVVASTLEKRITHSGKATWFHVGQGNCGKWNTDSDLIVALSSPMYFESDHCDQYLRIQANGKTVYAKVRDSCPPCGKYDIDLSPSAFKKLGIPLSKGVQKVSWNFMNKKWSPRDLHEIEAATAEPEDASSD